MRFTRTLLALLLLLGTVELHAQSRILSGKIVDQNGFAIPAATVKVKGSAGGTSAGDDGVFHLQVNGNPTIIVSAIGYEDIQVNTAQPTGKT